MLSANVEGTVNQIPLSIFDSVNQQPYASPLEHFSGFVSTVATWPSTPYPSPLHRGRTFSGFDWQPGLPQSPAQGSNTLFLETFSQLCQHAVCAKAHALSESSKVASRRPVRRPVEIQHRYTWQQYSEYLLRVSAIATHGVWLVSYDPG